MSAVVQQAEDIKREARIAEVHRLIEESHRQWNQWLEYPFYKEQETIQLAKGLLE